MSGADFSIRDLRADEYADFRIRQRDAYAADMISSGRDPDYARAHAESSTEAVLPPTERPADQVIRVAETSVEAADRRIGHIWVGPAPTGDPMAWVMDIEVEAPHRGKGWGRVLMAEAERIAGAAGYERIGLNVTGGNAPAIGLYTTLGYRVVAQIMAKAIARDT